MINKIAGSIAIIGLLMLIGMVSYAEVFGVLERVTIAIGAFIFIAPWLSLKAGQLIHEMNPPEGD